METEFKEGDISRIDAPGKARRAYLARVYLPELDGLRALSILIVISAHMKDQVWDWLAGRLGVTVFFVISGYLITELGLREERSRGSLHIPAFFVRRAFRLLPLYYFVLLVYCALIFGLGISPEKRVPLTGAMPFYLLYLQEWPIILGINGMRANIPFTQTWSLGIEEKFYLVWAFLGFAAWKNTTAVRLGGTVILVLITVLVPTVVGGEASQFFYPYSHILIGCAIALMLDDPTWFGRLEWLGRPRASWLILALLLVLHFAIPPLTYRWERLFQSAYAVTTALFLVVVLLGAGPIQRSLRRPGLVFVGKLSYGMYLVQLLVINAAEKIARPGTGNILVSSWALLLACIFSVISAYLLAVTIERPGTAMGRRFSDVLRRRGNASSWLPPLTLNDVEGPSSQASGFASHSPDDCKVSASAPSMN